MLDRKSNILEGTITDITDKKQTLKTLFQTELRYKNISEQTNGVCAQYIINPDGKRELAFIGGLVEEYLGVDLNFAYLNPLACLKLVHYKDRFKLFNYLFKSTDATKAWSLKVRIIQDGQVGRWLQVSSTPSTYLDGELIWSLVAVDITEQEKLATEKHSLESQVKQSQKMEALGTLAGGIAHDFNNILQGITFAIESCLLDQSLSDKSVDRLVKAQKFLTRGSDLVKQILTYCRRGTQELKPINMESHIEEVINLMESNIPRTVVIRPVIKTNQVEVMGNAVQIQQVLMNLCSNAGYAMKAAEAGRIDVIAQDCHIGLRKAFVNKVKSGHYLKIDVKDNGPGIPNSLQNRIFEPFFTTKPVGEGTGMGLAVVQGIIEAHAGFLELKSSPNVGTCFSIYLPSIATGLIL